MQLSRDSESVPGYLLRTLVMLPWERCDDSILIRCRHIWREKDNKEACMTFGLDYVSGPPIADLLAAKVSFVCRYTGYFSGYDINQPHIPQGKVLTPGEAKALLTVGISPVSNWEWYETRPLEGTDAGKWDADKAHQIHLACGCPPDRPSYFSVDTGVAGEEGA